MGNLKKATNVSFLKNIFFLSENYSKKPFIKQPKYVFDSQTTKTTKSFLSKKSCKKPFTKHPHDIVD